LKIRSRPLLENIQVGHGPYSINVTFEELQLIGAYLFTTRLGQGSVYKRSALNLLNALDEVFDEDFTENAFTDVGLTISHVDPNDTIINTLVADEFVLEVL